MIQFHYDCHLFVHNTVLVRDLLVFVSKLHQDDNCTGKL